MTQLDAIQAADFNWTVRLDEVWGPPGSDVAGLHAKIRAAFSRKLETMESQPNGGSPLGWVVVGAGGTGKTHLLGAFRREATLRNCPFILVDLTDVRNFWDSVLHGYIGSLEREIDDGVPQYRRMLDNIIARYGPGKPFTAKLAELLGRKSGHARTDVNDMLGALARPFPRETKKYQDSIRALIGLNSDDFAESSLASSWLRGLPLDDEDRRRLGFVAAKEAPIRIVEALSWLMSLAGPAVVAFDQLDPIVAQLHYRKQGTQPSEAEQATAESIIVEIGGGLGALRDVTRNTLTLVSCVEFTWEVLGSTVIKNFLDRFEEPWRLADAGAELNRAIVAGRLAPAYREAAVTPPYPTYPFLPAAFEEVRFDSPREVLKRCHAYLSKCLNDERVVELESFGGEVVQQPVDGTDLPEAASTLDQRFETLRAAARPDWMLDEKLDDERLAPLLQDALRCLVVEANPGSDVLARVDVHFVGGKKTAPLHARLGLTFPCENEREEHYCVRALQQTNARAFQSRLKDALTTSGIDQSLKSFRRLAIVRTTSRPGGALTKKLIEDFEAAGGVFLEPTEDELRTLHALHQLSTPPAPGLQAWLKARRPASGLAIVQGIVTNEGMFKPQPDPPDDGPTVNQTPDGGSEPGPISGRTKEPKGERTSVPSQSVDRLPLGRRATAGAADEVGLPVKLLSKHAVVLAGSGSGKTVFLKRMIEEAALLGVPSIVVDVANDMAALGDRWAEPPATWTDDDRAKADAYHRKAEVVVWTPGREAGNPVAFEPLPDLASLVDDASELEDAITMAVAALSPIVAAGKGDAAKQKGAVLTSALGYLARHGGGRIEALVELLADLPPEAGVGVGKESKLAAQMADALRAEIVLNPMLRSTGAALDPALLFGSDRAADPTRVSVVSLIGLPDLEAQRYFLNQLAMTLFSWIKKNPNPGDRPIRGLLAIDEARDFVPATRTTVCGESLIRLAAQARKYQLGLVFATQNPKDVHNKIMGNCATHVYGKMNAPVAIETVREQLALRGGSGDDVAKLPQGRFHVHNADAPEIARPIKIDAPMCLSQHPSSPLDEAAILEKAAASRAQLRARPRDLRVPAAKSM